MVPKAKKKKYRNLAVILFSIAAIAVLVITANTAILIDSLSILFRENLEERLLALVRSAAQIASPEELEQLRKPEDMSKPLYSAIRSRLFSFGNRYNVSYVYYYYLRDDNTVQPIVDNDTTENAYTLNMSPIPMEDAVMEAISKRAAVTTSLEKYSTSKEKVLSAYAPVINIYGQIKGIVGVDISDKQLISARERLKRFLVLLISAMAFTLACGLSSILIYIKNEKKLTKQLNQQELMSSLAGNFISDKKIEDLINGALRISGTFLGVNRMAVNIFKKGFTANKPAYHWQKEQGEYPMPDSEGYNNLLKNSFPPINPGIDTVILFCNDVEKNEKYRCMKPAGITAFILAPLYVDGKFWAILSVEYCNGLHIWSESDRQLVNTVASVISGATARKLRENERDEARKTAENASRAKTEFLSNMSHEMRTPMNAVIGMTAIAKNSNFTEKKDYCLNKIEEASNHLLGVINDILDMSKIEANKFELSPVEFSFEKMLQKVITVSSYRIDEKRQDLTIRIDKDVPMVLIGDDQRLSQVITNLVSNANKFTPDAGHIHIEAKQIERTEDHSTIQISVSDSGIGITDEQKKRLFKSFVQADSGTSRKYGGTGLGLAICKSIVTMMHGKIWVESIPGKGSTFSFTVILEIGKIHKQQNLLNAGVDWNNIKILVVDDDKSVREFFGEIANWFSINCSIASSSAEAIKLIEKNGYYDIYFLDWKMPGMDGLELAKQIKNRNGPETKSVVTIISNAELTLEEEKTKQAGVDKFVLKPLFPSAIADCINQCIGREVKDFGKKETAEPDNFSDRRILLAEDVEINREIVQALLEPTGIEVICAGNGKEALELYSSNPEKFDMIFMDLQMPEMDGYEATRRIRAFEAGQSQVPENAKHPETNALEFAKQTPLLSESPSGIPIIAMTANVFREDVEKCLAAGMNGHVGKPIDMEEVLLWLRKYLGNRCILNRA